MGFHTYEDQPSFTRVGDEKTDEQIIFLNAEVLDLGIDKQWSG